MTPSTALRRLAVSAYAAPPDCTLERFCGLLARRGIGGIGLTARAVEDRTPAQLAALLAAHGLRCTSLNSAGYFLHSNAALAARQSELDARLLDCAAALAAPVNVIPGGLDDAAMPTAVMSLAEARRRAVDGLERLASAAVEAGVRLSLEPIQPLGLTDKGCINQLSHARSVVGRLPGVGLTLDLFHSWWDADLEMTVEDATDDLFVVQVCGVETGPPGVPPRRTDMAKGAADVAGLLALLASTGWAGLVEYEVMHFQRPQEPVALLDRAVADFVSLTHRQDEGRAAP
ncbi:sugar phosphate isomerase/epimerase family protein [Micromonospora sp. NPDC005087]|uniref:sugar phosphate isomerase/epimerase family protein n=1 Tax=Micromonospora sp. NPDC005087 TaxID=3364225 RepID=UPI003675C5BA